MTRAIGSVAAASLLAITLAACGDGPINSPEGVRNCVKGNGAAIEKQLTDKQKSNYCKCILPKLEQAGFKNASDFEDAMKDPKGLAAIRECALKYLTRGYG